MDQTQLWVNLVQDLEDLVRASHAPQQQPVAQHLQRCDELLHTIQRADSLTVTLLAPVQTTNWRRLVNVEQVPRRLLEACSDASTAPPLAPLLLECLCVALNQLWSVNTYLNLELARRQTAVSTAKQLLEAGLAQRLQTITQAVVAGLQQLPPPAAITEQLLKPEQPSPLHASWAAARHLYGLFDRLGYVFPEVDMYTAEIAAVRLACSMQLSTATFQHLSCCLEHMPPQLASPPQVVTDMLEQACRASMIEEQQWSMPDKSNTAMWSSYLQLLSMQQQCVPCLGISLLVVTCAMLVQDEGLPATSVPSRAADAWQLACNCQDGARASHSELLKLLGCSSKTLLYAASTLLLTHAECVSTVIGTQSVFAGVLRAPQLSEQSREQQLLTYRLAFLLPCVLLLWASESDSQFMDDCVLRFAAQMCNFQWTHLKVYASEDAAVHVLRMRMLGSQWHVQQRKRDKKGKKGRRHAQQSQGVLERDQQQGVQASSQQQPSEVAASLAAWLASREPDALTDPVVLAGKLLRRMLQQLQESSSSSGSTNTAASGASSSSTSNAALDLAKTSRACVQAVAGLACLDEILSRAVAAQQADTDTGLHSLVRSTWQEQTGELYWVIEEFLRWRLCAGSLPELPPPSKAGERGRYLLFYQGSVPSVLLEAVAAAGPGGNRQLWGLAVTLMKAVAQEPQGNHVDSLRHCVADVLDAVLFNPPQPQHRGCSPDSSSSSRDNDASSSDDDTSSSNSNSSSSDGAAGPEAAGAADVRAVVPWLVLAGHCLESWAHQLSQQLCVTPELLAEVQQLTPAAMQDLLEGRDDVSRGQRDQQERDLVQRGPGAKQGVAGLKERLLVSRLSLLLADSIPAQQLLAAGYAVAPLWRELTIVRELDCLVLDVERHSEPLQQGALVLKLQQVGQRLRALPCSWACNNPSCGSSSNFAGASELLAKRKYCSRCCTAAYCSQECLVAHFKQHKGDCKALAAAAASAGEGDAV